MNDSELDLASRECGPIPKGTSPLSGAALEALASELGNDWKVVEAHHLERKFKFADFVTALAFVNRVGELAEEVNHHPNIALSWGAVTLSISTHTVGGLSLTDFVWAARAHKLYSREPR